MSDVVDLNQKRLDKALREQEQNGIEVVQLLACGGCRGIDFQMAHDHTVVCSTCKVRIGPLRWIDVNQPEVPA